VHAGRVPRRGIRFESVREFRLRWYVGHMFNRSSH
jgi:hypothetical protein